MLFILFMSFFCLALFPMRQIMGDHVAWGKHIAKVLIDVFDFQHFAYSCKPSIFKDSLNSAFSAAKWMEWFFSASCLIHVLPEEVRWHRLKGAQSFKLGACCLREATKDFGAWNLKVAQHASGIAFVKTINIRANRLSKTFKPTLGMKKTQMCQGTEYRGCCGTIKNLPNPSNLLLNPFL